MFAPNYVYPSIHRCQILYDKCENTSDHFALSCTLGLPNEIVNVKTNYRSKEYFPRPRWHSESFVNSYKLEIKELASRIPVININSVKSDDNISEILNNLCDDLSYAIHEATRRATIKVNQEVKF